MQTKKHSGIEALVNVLVGYAVAITSQVIIFPWYGVHISLEDNLFIGLWFTVISLVRSYALRRAFNWHTYKSTDC